jgi:hypothetical protein
MKREVEESKVKEAKKKVYKLSSSLITIFHFFGAWRENKLKVTRFQKKT